MGSASKQEFPPLLPLGFHRMALAEMRETFVNKIPGSRRRKAVMDGLEKIIEKLIAENIQSEIWLDGSFVTKKIDPDDSDIVAVIQWDFFDGATSSQKSIIDWLSTDLMPGFLCHSHVLFQYPESHNQCAEGAWLRSYWHRQFGFTRKDSPKGIVVIKTP
jgi:hypothetical protein